MHQIRVPTGTLVDRHGKDGTTRSTSMQAFVNNRSGNAVLRVVHEVLLELVSRFYTGCNILAINIIVSRLLFDSRHQANRSDVKYFAVFEDRHKFHTTDAVLKNFFRPVRLVRMKGVELKNFFFGRETRKKVFHLVNRGMMDVNQREKENGSFFRL